jgi:predicted permease
LHGIQSQLAAVPGVRAAALSAGSRPLRNYSEVPFWLAGQPKPFAQTKMNFARFYLVQPGYLRVMRIALKRGRFFTPADTENAPLVTVIDSRFAQVYFHGQDPIGKRISFDVINLTAEIIGVVGHVRQSGLGSDSSLGPQCYLALPELPDSLISTFRGDVAILLRTAGPPAAAVGAIHEAVHRINGRAVMYDAETMDSILSDSLAARRFLMILLGIFAGLSVVMSCVGIYGVVSYAARQRTHEIGIRMALGARRSDLLRMVLGEGIQLALVGVAVGTAGALALTRFLSSMLFGITPTDPLTFVSVSLLLIAAAVLSCYIPARRATKVDPTIALRHE